LVLSGVYRWLGALVLAYSTLLAIFIANRFWEIALPERFAVASSPFEQVGLIGGFVLVAWRELRLKAASDDLDAHRSSDSVGISRTECRTECKTLNHVCKG
jgi:hypothetical protein